MSRIAIDRILLVGASGRLGQLVAASWRERVSHRVAFVAQSRTAGDLVDLVYDPREGGALTQALGDGGGRTAVVVLAGVTPGSSSPMSDNVSVAQAWLRASRDAGVSRVFLASSSAVYGRGCVPFSEESLPNPVNDYGRSKLDMEGVARDWASGDMEVCCLRIGNVAGADALIGGNVGVKRSLYIDQFNDGAGPRRSYIGPRTFADVIEKLCFSDSILPSIMNVAAPKPVTMQELAAAAKFDWKWRPAPASAVQNVELDCRRLSSFYKFRPPDSSASAIIKQVEYLRSV